MQGKQEKHGWFPRSSEAPPKGSENCYPIVFCHDMHKEAAAQNRGSVYCPGFKTEQHFVFLGDWEQKSKSKHGCSDCYSVSSRHRVSCEVGSLSSQKLQRTPLHPWLDPMVWSCFPVWESSLGVYKGSQTQARILNVRPVGQVRPMALFHMASPPPPPRQEVSFGEGRAKWPPSLQSCLRDHHLVPSFKRLGIPALKYGPIFTICLLGKRYTFVTEEEGFKTFCTSKDVDFEQAVQEAVEHTVSVPEDIFYKNRSRIYAMMKGRLSSFNLQQFSGSLCHELKIYIENLGPEGTEELTEIVRRIMFPTTANILFGKDVFLSTRDNIREFEEHFQDYDNGFEYGTQLPGYFLRKWTKSKKWLLKHFEKVEFHAKKSNPSDGSSKTVYQHVLDILHGKQFGANYGLLLLWASQANTIPVAFWTLAFILSHASVYKKIMKDLETVYGKSGKEDIRVSENDLKNLQFIKCCILETLRLRASGAIVKKVVNPIEVQNFIIPPGDLLMISPYWVHRNPKYFPEPHVFKPDRWKEANLEKNTFMECFVAFGGGTHLCPGRWFAIMEIHILIVLLLTKYECQLLDPVPNESPLHLMGTQQPEGPCRIQYKLRP